jgi:hypothetical protein
MARWKGRPQRHRLADMTIRPPKPVRHEAPPHDEEFDRPEEPTRDVVIHRVRRYHRGHLVDFAVTLDRKVDGEWRQIARIDSAHGNVHEHRFFPSGRKEKTVFEWIELRRRERTLERWYDRAAAMIDNGWPDYLEEWERELDRG